MWINTFSIKHHLVSHLKVQVEHYSSAFNWVFHHFLLNYGVFLQFGFEKSDGDKLIKAKLPKF